jgi:hypothetical protein
MTQDEIIALAMEAEFVSRGNTSREESELFVCTDKDIVHFANLVVEAERERIKRANAPEIEKINAHIEHAMREVQRLGQEIEQALKERNR